MRCLIALTLLACSAAASAQPQADFYVALDGNDAWTGRLAAPNVAKSDGPFASLERARDAVRALKGAGDLQVPVTILVRAGVYALGKTFVLTAEDAGFALRSVCLLTDACPSLLRKPRDLPAGCA